MIKEILKYCHKEATSNGFFSRDYNKLEELMSTIKEISRLYKSSHFESRLVSSFISICRFSLLCNNSSESTSELIKQYENYSSEQYNKLIERKKSNNTGERIFEIISTISSIPAFEKSVAKGYIEGCCLGLINNLAKDNNIDLMFEIRKELFFKNGL